MDEAIFAGFKDGDDADKDFGMNGVVSELLLPLIAGLRIDDAIYVLCIMYVCIYNNNMYIILLLFLFNPLLFCL
jgi:hypothetical protein